ncbi:MAG: DNA polymerase III subunit gamma/tau [Acidimicrobiales bacterium]|nr:DNA polymerase III subunit gamma/tau [Acidimicrobiales bacterium]
MAYQTLYRRYRSQRFSDLVGQDHVVRALRSAVRDERVGHAYLFSGPRGTGKTSTARILAKALNCDHLEGGDPCGTCESCRSIESGASFDLHELDAASNNGVEAIRDLISRTGIGSPGRTKVYILDEVHMLSAGASNALLKTLEDPPPHVVFVLATTDPHKVLPTIRSRTQHLEFGLIAADVLAAHVRWVIADAGLDVDEEGIGYALRQGGGSARDTLSALEQIVSAGGVPTEGGSSDEIIDALCERDSGAAMAAVASAMAVGREPRPLAEDLLGALRDVFLASVGGPLDHLTDTTREQARDRAHRMGRASITRALELVGEAIADMRHVGDTRIPLEVALVRLSNPEVDTSLEALVERVSRLERLLEGGGAPAPTSSPGPAPAAHDAPAAPGAASAPPSVPPPPMPPRAGSSPKSDPRSAAPPPSPAEPVSPERPEASPPSSGGELPSLDAMASAWQAQVMGRLSNRARARYGAGRFVAVDTHAVFALPNPIHRDRCEDLRPEVESALADHFGVAVPLRLVVDGESVPGPDSGPAGARATAQTGAPPAGAGDGGRGTATATDTDNDGPDDPDDVGDVSELSDADVGAPSSVERITELFPGAEVVEEQR